MSDEELSIECNQHGKSSCAVVCQHLIKTSGEPLGFVENSSEPGDYQGWCNACEELYLQELDLTEKFKEFNGMSVVCEKCYFEIRDNHETAS